MLTVLWSLIQPQLDYCSQLWSPRDQGGINRLEAVQKQFISKIKSPELNGKDYWEKLLRSKNSGVTDVTKEVVCHTVQCKVDICY